MIQFCDREIENERLVLDSKTELYYLGHNLTLRKCTLVMRVPARALVISRTKLIDCTIEVKKELKNFRWTSAFLKGCRFTGRLSSCDFGNWPDEPGKSGIEGCDFSAALLNECRFIGCDASTLKFPSWPCFTILDPVRRLHELAAVPWPGQLGILVDILKDNPVETAAVTFSATKYGEMFGASEEEIKTALAHLGGVIF